jgi:hypothetical protein
MAHGNNTTRFGRAENSYLSSRLAGLSLPASKGREPKIYAGYVIDILLAFLDDDIKRISEHVVRRKM